MTHTPIPWRSSGRRTDAGGHEAPPIIEAQGRTIAHMQYLGPRAEADAELIARAVNSHSDLVDACNAARSWLAQFGEHAPIQFGGEAQLDEHLRVALRKATGEQS